MNAETPISIQRFISGSAMNFHNNFDQSSLARHIVIDFIVRN